LYFGVTKCVLLSLNFKPSSTYYLGDSTLTTVSFHRELGVVVSSNLSWTTQILNKAYKSLGLLRHIFCHYMQKKLLYLSLVRSKVTYCSQIQHPYLLKDIIIFERLQRRATKFFLNNYTDDYKQRLTNLKLLPLMYQFDYYDMISRFFINSIKNPNPSFNILDCVSFCSGDNLLIISFELLTHPEITL